MSAFFGAATVAFFARFAFTFGVNGSTVVTGVSTFVTASAALTYSSFGFGGLPTLRSATSARAVSLMMYVPLILGAGSLPPRINICTRVWWSPSFSAASAS